MTDDGGSRTGSSLCWGGWEVKTGRVSGRGWWGSLISLAEAAGAFLRDTCCILKPVAAFLSSLWRLHHNSACVNSDLPRLYWSAAIWRENYASQNKQGRVLLAAGEDEWNDSWEIQVWRKCENNRTKRIDADADDGKMDPVVRCRMSNVHASFLKDCWKRRKCQQNDS